MKKSIAAALALSSASAISAPTSPVYESYFEAAAHGKELALPHHNVSFINFDLAALLNIP